MIPHSLVQAKVVSRCYSVMVLLWKGYWNVIQSNVTEAERGRETDTGYLPLRTRKHKVNSDMSVSLGRIKGRNACDKSGRSPVITGLGLLGEGENHSEIQRLQQALGPFSVTSLAYCITVSPLSYTKHETPSNAAVITENSIIHLGALRRKQNSSLHCFENFCY